MAACLLTPQTSAQAQTPGHGCQKPLNPSKRIVIPSSRAEDRAMLSFQSPKLKTQPGFSSAKQEGSQEKETRLESGWEAELHSYWDKAKGSTGTWWERWGVAKDALGGIQPSKAVEFSTLSVSPRWFVHFIHLTGPNCSICWKKN